MSGHSKGPWRRGLFGAVVCDEPTGLPGADDVAYYGGNLVCESVAQKNIPIIAAAPEMYEALQFIESLYDDERSSGELAMALYEARNMARAVLAKVEG